MFILSVDFNQSEISMDTISNYQPTDVINISKYRNHHEIKGPEIEFETTCEMG